ncbi:unnamed protein product, partial [Larinioides sclopetarius]
MYSDANYRKIAFCLLLSFLCSNSVISETIATGSKAYEAAKQGNSEDKIIYSKDENASLPDSLTTTIRYMQQDSIDPTAKPTESAGRNSISGLSCYVIAFVVLTLILLVLACSIHITLKIRRHLFIEP